MYTSCPLRERATLLNSILQFHTFRNWKRNKSFSRWNTGTAELANEKLHSKILPCLWKMEINIVYSPDCAVPIRVQVPPVRGRPDICVQCIYRLRDWGPNCWNDSIDCFPSSTSGTIAFLIKPWSHGTHPFIAFFLPPYHQQWFWSITIRIFRASVKLVGWWQIMQDAILGHRSRRYAFSRWTKLSEFPNL